MRAAAATGAGSSTCGSLGSVRSSCTCSGGGGGVSCRLGLLLCGLGCAVLLATCMPAWVFGASISAGLIAMRYVLDTSFGRLHMYTDLPVQQSTLAKTCAACLRWKRQRHDHHTAHALTQLRVVWAGHSP